LRAAVLRAFRQPLELAEVPAPELRNGDVLVEVRAVGLCGTDLKITGGLFADTPLPLIPGHEVAGVVVAGTEQVAEGTRVACYIYDPCGKCARCLGGQPTLCPSSRRIGFDHAGGLARFLRMRACNVLPMSEGVPFEHAAVAMDAVMSPWRALVVRAQLQAGQRLVIAGAGGLGLNGLQIARGLGAAVAVIDPHHDHRGAAIELGAELAVTGEETARVIDWSRGGADVAFEASGTRSGFDALLASVRPGARLITNGYRPGVEYGVDSSVLALQELTIMGSRAGSREDARHALLAVEEGMVKPLISQILPLAEVNWALDQVRAGEALGRVVVNP